MPDCNLIDEGLYQGASPKYAAIPLDVDAVLNLEFERTYDYERCYGDSDGCKERGMPIIKAYTEMPIHDQYFPGIPWLRRAVNLVEMWRKEGLTVYVHCTAGISRSSMVVAGYLMKKHGWTHGKAIEHIQNRRCEAYPNSHFREGLKEFYEYLRRP